jgi:hypothetical protein
MNQGNDSATAGLNPTVSKISLSKSPLCGISYYCFASQFNLKLGLYKSAGRNKEISMNYSKLMAYRSVRTRFLPAALTAVVLLLAGCGLGGSGLGGNGLPSSGSTSDPVESVSGVISGHAHGGEQAITGATVNLYATASEAVLGTNYATPNGVYTPATALAPIATGTTSDGSGIGGNASNANNTLPAGSFSLTVATPCNAPDYMYATINGGNTGGGSNSNYILMAIVGACTGSATSYQTDIDEVTTVAAAYALSGFTSISGTTVSVVSSSTNYMTASTTAGSYSMAGLGHAILNTYNLANPNLSTNTQGTAAGTANTTIAALGTNQATYLPASVPTAEINTIASALQACVNSRGGSASVGSSAAAFTTPTAATSSAGASATLGPLTGTNVDGPLSISLNGATATTMQVGSGTSLTTLANNINSNATLSGEGIGAAVASGVLTVTGPTAANQTLNFTTPTIPTATTGAVADIYGFVTGNGTVSFTVGSTPYSQPISGTTSLATFVSAFNTAFTGSGVTASSSGTTLIVTGPTGTANTLSFSGTSLTGTLTQALSFTGTALEADTTDGSICGTLFAATTPTGGSVPTNTLQAVLNLAKNPYINSGAVSAIFNLLPPQVAFAPVLTAAPKDWTVSITYIPQFSNAASNPYTYPKYLTIDANDNVYVFVPNATSSPTTASLYKISSNGTYQYATGTSGTCAANTALSGATVACSSIYGALTSMAADGVGNLWAAVNSTTVFQLQTSNGAVIYAYNGAAKSNKGVAVDTKNDVFWTSAQVADSQVAQFVYAGTTPNQTGTTGGVPYGPAAGGTIEVGYGYGIISTTATNTDAWGTLLDSYNNVWWADYQTSGLGVSVLGNQNTAASPSYVAGSYATSYPSGCSTGSQTSTCHTTANPAYVTETFANGSEPYGVAVDGTGGTSTSPASGNGWAVSNSGTQALQQVIATRNSNGGVTALSNGGSYSTGAGFTSPRWPEVDGGGKVWISDNGSHGVEVFNIASSSFASESGGYSACAISANTCLPNNVYTGGVTPAFAGVYQLIIDSTGSVWVTSGSSSITTGYDGTVVQMIGTGSPTWWPGATKPGQMP